MFNQQNNKLTVRRQLLKGKKAPDGLSALNAVCSAGAQCPEVKSSPVAMAALNDLESAVTAAQKSLANRQALAQALMVAIKTLQGDLGIVQIALQTYQAAVVGVANGDGTVINKAGLNSRATKGAPLGLEKVSTATSAPGKSAAWALLTWPKAAGATAYAIELNFTPQNLGGPWVAITPGSRRKRAVKGPGPGAQFLARIASLGGNGEQTEWSDPILVTAL